MMPPVENLKEIVCCSELGVPSEKAGARFPRGGVPWRQEEAIRRRNVALHEPAERPLGNLWPARTARASATPAVRDAALVWRYDGESSAMQAKYPAKPSINCGTPSHRAQPCQVTSANLTNACVCEQRDLELGS